MIEYKEVTPNTRTGKGYEKIVWGNGSIWYKLDGQFHREDGPAYIDPDGYQAWYINHELHREDGPAVIWPDNTVEYWLNNTPVTHYRYHEFSPLELAKLGLI